jgi:hypothetical protein
LVHLRPQHGHFERLQRLQYLRVTLLLQLVKNDVQQDERRLRRLLRLQYPRRQEQELRLQERHLLRQHQQQLQQEKYVQ